MVIGTLSLIKGNKIKNYKKYLWDKNKIRGFKVVIKKLKTYHVSQSLILKRNKKFVF